MRKIKKLLLPSAVSTIITTALSPYSLAQDEKVVGVLEEIIVTAQKKQESINDVPMSITAATGDMLKAAGVADVSDLGKIVPGFAAAPGQYGSPNFTMRGVGNESDNFISQPAVSVYVDQAPITYGIMAQGLAYDLERVEVLKGPQGTLFGQNSTGGAINFIPAKPGDEVEYGADISYGRFNELNAEGFYSVPISDTFGVRLSGRVETSDGWQESVTRDDELGEREFFAGRVIVDWQATEKLNLLLNLNGWSNESDTQASQFLDHVPQNIFVPPGRAEATAFYGENNDLVDLSDNRRADWTPDVEGGLKHDAEQFQVVLRGIYEINDSITLTSITNYVDHASDTDIATDGTAQGFFVIKTPVDSIETFSQELRLSGNLGEHSEWMLGASYQNDEAVTGTTAAQRFSSTPPVLDAPDVNTPVAGSMENQESTTKGVFAGYEYKISDTLEAQASIRYSETEHEFSACVLDTGLVELFPGQGPLSGSLSVFPPGHPLAGQSFISNAMAGGCVTTIVEPTPTSLGEFGLAVVPLEEDNVSWRLGLNWTPNEESLIYGNITRGYKAANYPRIPAFTPLQWSPNPQEEVTAYEIGVKQSFTSAQLNAAVFYYDYKDKQTIGSYDQGPPFGFVPLSVSVPEAEIFGFEADLLWQASKHIRVGFGFAYVDSEIESEQYTGFDGSLTTAQHPLGDGDISLDGLPLPAVSEWTFSGNLEYRLPLSNGSEFYAVMSPQYRSDYRSVLVPESDSRLKVDDYLLLDLRAGLQLNENLSFEVWGRNVTDEYYHTSINRTGDHVVGYTGQPATYGIRVNYRN